MILLFIPFIVSLIQTLFTLKNSRAQFEVIIEYTRRMTNDKNTRSQSSIANLDHYLWNSIDVKTRFSFLKKLANSMAQFLSKIAISSWAYVCLDPRPRYCARLMHFGGRGPSDILRRQRNALTQRAWKDADRDQAKRTQLVFCRLNLDSWPREKAEASFQKTFEKVSQGQRTM